MASSQNTRGGSVKSLFRITFLTLVPVLFSISSFVQDVEAVEKISVIGSHIKRVQAEGPSPILVIDRHQIEASPHQSVSDLLRNLPVATNGAGRGLSGQSPATATDTSLRGMRADEVLVLINKVRVVSTGGSNVVDLSAFPLIAIERIEILKDGSSALYGADAIGGVINIVTRRNFKGVKVSTQGSLAQREEGNTLTGLASFVDFWDWDRKDFSGKGDQLNVEAVYGGDKDSISYLLAGQLRVHTPLYLRDRSFGRPRTEHFSDTGSPGSWKSEEALKWNPGPKCPKDRIDNTGLCRFDFSPYMQFTPQEIHAKVFLHAVKPLGASVLESQTIYSMIRSRGIVAPAPDRFSGPKKTGDSDYRIPPNVFNNLLQKALSQGNGINNTAAVSATGPVTMLYRIVDEKGAGSREAIIWNHFLHTQVRFVQSVMDTMEFEGNVSASGNYYTITNHKFFNKEILFNSLQDGTFNPLLPKGKKSDISKARYEPLNHIFSGLVSVEPRLSGEWLEIQGQPLFFATGALGGWQYYLDHSDEVTTAGKQWGGGVAHNGSGNRAFGGVYGELSSVIAGQAELQLAARTDYYQGFGLAWQEWELPFTETSVPFPFSPKAAISWQLVNPLKLRASWGLGFKVPSLGVLFQDESVSAESARDMKLCTEEYFKTHEKNKECNPGTQYKTFIRGNPDIGPELTESINVGLVLEPVEQLSFSMDYYSTRQQGGLGGALGLRSVFEYEAKNGIEKLRELGMDVKRRADGSVEHVVTTSVNASRSRLHGVEFDTILRVPVRNGWYAGLKVEHSHLLYTEGQATEESDVKTGVPFYSWMKSLFGVEDGEKNRKTNLTYPDAPRWRNRATISFRNDNLGQEYNLVVHNMPSRLQTQDSPADAVIDHYWQLDVSGTWELSQKSEVIFGINNVLGLDRPHNLKRFYPASYVDPDLYSLRGRTLNVRYTYRF